MLFAKETGDERDDRRCAAGDDALVHLALFLSVAVTLLSATRLVMHSTTL